ncbi:8718_t:CDS:1 [Ambispora gerdemannii]|uniref:8718_t:CDS:1 n=1 Tax=Ambispora gerdemannii TaxID=144530 RepID=A0A9N9GNB7_9GLOM|nr:8718_t:CDS:1 [Ambispora gerdemannii]
MVKLSYFLLILCTIVAAGNANLITPCTVLSGTYSQAYSREFVSQKLTDRPGHVANIVFETKIPGFNPDSSGIFTNVQCCSDEIILTSKSSLKEISNWPPRVILWVSHMWTCNGKKTNQFFIVGNSVIDEEEGTAKFAHPQIIDISKYANIMTLDIEYITPCSRSCYRSKRHESRHENLTRRDIDNELALNLNVWYDPINERSSQPNFLIASSSEQQGIVTTSVNLLCANCYATGKTTVGLHVKTNFVGLPATVTLSLYGDFKVNLDFALKGHIGVAKKFPDVPLVSVGIPGLSIPALFNIGPEVALLASAKIDVGVDTVLSFGADVTSTIDYSIELIGKGVGKKEFNINSTVHPPPDANLTGTVDVAASLKPQISIGISVLSGLLNYRAGINFVTTLDSKLSIGSCEKPISPKIKISLEEVIEGFYGSNKVPIYTFPSNVLLEKCLI